MQTVKCFVVGDYAAGKTHLLKTFTCSTTLQDIHIIQNHRMTVMSRGKPVSLDLWDVTSISDYDRLRSFSYPAADVFLVCFSVVCPFSFVNVKEKWVPVTTQYCPDTPFLLVGTRTDLRNDHKTLEKLTELKKRPLKPEDGEELARVLKAVKYMECSAETKEGLKELFDEAVLVALGEDAPEKDKSSKQCVLQ